MAQAAARSDRIFVAAVGAAAAPMLATVGLPLKRKWNSCTV
jgi:hypothetical protein